MEKKNVFGLGLLLVALIVIGGSIFYLYVQREKDTPKDVPNDTPRVEEPKSYDDLSLEYDYLGDNLWSYTITGTLPNICYEVETEAIVMENDPDQVTVNSKIILPDPEIACAQVIQEVYKEGEFEASEGAEILFSIEEANHIFR